MTPVKGWRDEAPGSAWHLGRTQTGARMHEPTPSHAGSTQGQAEAESTLGQAWSTHLDVPVHDVVLVQVGEGLEEGVDDLRGGGAEGRVAT